METSADETPRRDEPEDAVRVGEAGADESAVDQEPPNDDDFVPV